MRNERQSKVTIRSTMTQHPIPAPYSTHRHNQARTGRLRQAHPWGRHPSQTPLSGVCKIYAPFLKLLMVTTGRGRVVKEIATSKTAKLDKKFLRRVSKTFGC